MFLSFLVFLIVILAVYVFKKRNLNNINGYPPGPLVLPFIGSAWALGTRVERMHVALHKLCQQYGPVLRLKIGSTHIVVLSDPSIIRDTFNGTDSPALLHFTPLTLKKLDKGVSIFYTTERKTWSKMRHTFSPMTRNLPGGTPIPQVIANELKKLFAELDKAVGKEVPLNPLFTFFTRNVFLNITTRQSWSYNQLQKDEAAYAKALVTLMDNIVSFFDYIPSLDFMRSRSANIAFQQGKILDAYVYKLIEKRREEGRRTESTPPRDLLDMLIQECDQNPEFDEEKLVINFKDVLVAGSFTVADTLDWLVLFLCEHPDIQEKCFKEIEEKTKGRNPTMDDQAELSYLECVIKETLRLRAPAPLAVPHLAERDCIIGGYRVDKGSVIMLNLYAIGNSEKIFENYKTFDPERWLRNPSLSSNLMHFGYGPTICLGMPIAKQELFLAASSLIQRYKFSYGDSSAIPAHRFVGEFKIVFNPAKWNTLITVR